MSTKLKVVHEAEAQRQHIRLKLPLQAIIEDISYTVLDLSVAGFSTEGLYPAPAAGAVLDVRLVFPFEGFEFTQAIRAQVVYASAAGRLGCRFTDMTMEQLSLLQFIVDAYISGEMVHAGDLLEVSRRNMFVAPRKLPAPDQPSGPLGAALHGLRRAATAGAVVLTGLLVFGYAALAVYELAFVTDGKGVVVSPEVQLARAQISGTLTPQTSAKGQRVAVGELIAVIQAPDGTIKPVASDCDCLVANEPIPKGTFVSRGTVIARLVPPQAYTLVEVHIPLERLEGIETGQRVRLELFGGQEPAWGSIDRVERHTPIDGTVDTTYGVIMIDPDTPLPSNAVGEPAVVQIHRLNWLGRWAAPKISAATPQS